jgi:hypothetical protein
MTKVVFENLIVPRAVKEFPPIMEHESLVFSSRTPEISCSQYGIVKKWFVIPERKIHF